MPNKLIALAQNKAGHYNVNDPKNQNVGLLVMDLSNCAAILFSDLQGNRCLIHADSKTDLTFLKTAAKKMEGSYTIDVIVDKPTFNKKEANTATVGEAFVMPYLKEHFPDKKNSKGKGEQVLRFTNYGTVLVLNGKLETPQRKHLTEIQELNRRLLKDKEDSEASNRRLRRLLKDEDQKVLPISNDNSYAKDTLDEGPKSYALRRVTRYLNSHLVAEKAMPTAVFWNGSWTKQSIQLAKPALEKRLEFLRTRGESIVSFMEYLMDLQKEGLSVSNIQQLNSIPDYLFHRELQVAAYDAFSPLTYAFNMKIVNVIRDYSGVSILSEKDFMQIQREESLLEPKQSRSEAPFLAVIPQGSARQFVDAHPGYKAHVAGILPPGGQIREATPQEKQALKLGQQPR